MPATPTTTPHEPSLAPSWQREWNTAFRNIEGLLKFLGLNPQEAPERLDSDPRFPIRVPRNYAARMRKGDWNDPLLKQVLSLKIETTEHPGFVSDAVGDGAAEQQPGVLRKYQGRALLLLSGACAVHCRYCFRREFPYEDLPASRTQWEQTYADLADDSTVEEILFSGGDPLSLSDANLRWHWERAVSLPRLKRIRIHTRLPVVIPSRIDTSFTGLTQEMAKRKPVYIVLHINHANEINAELKDRVGALHSAGAVLLNQSVLLKEVNDNADALVALSERLLDAGVLPYYLHQLDRVRGAAHFEVAEEKGLMLMEELRRRLPGYGVPKYVREIAGELSKMEVTSP